MATASTAAGAAATQVATEPPTFVVFTNQPKGVPEHYLRYLSNGFRAVWGFTGSPLRIRLRGRRREGANRE